MKRIALLLALLCLPLVAVADGPPVPGTSAAVVAAPVVAPGSIAAPLPSPDDPVSIIQAIIGAGRGGQWWMVGALAAVLLIWISRSVLARFVPWFSTDRGGAVLALIIGLLGAAAATFASGKPSVSAIADGIKLALVAIGAYVSAKKLVAPSDV